MTHHTSHTSHSTIRTVVSLAGISLERNVGIEELREHLEVPENTIWMDVTDPGPDDLAMLLAEFGFHPLAIEELAAGEQRPRIAEYSSYRFIVLYGVVPGADVHDARTVELDLFVGRNYVVTVHREPLPALDEAMTRWTKGGAMLREGAGFLLYSIINSIVNGYFPIINDIESRMDDLEIEMSDVARRRSVESLLRLKRLLFILRRVLFPMREIFHVLLRSETNVISEQTMVYIADVHDHLLRLLDVIEMELNMVDGTLDAHMTVMSSRLNTTMRALTVITVILGIGAFIFGAWGMNVGEVPMGEGPWGFWVVLGGTLFMIGAAIFYSKKREWL